MRIEIEREPAVKRWAIWIVRDGGGGGSNLWQWFPEVNGGPTWLEVKSQIGERLPPSLRIDDEVWQGLAPAILGLPTDQAPLADHLNDARQVRDRLLTLVEAGFNACVPDGTTFGPDK